MPCSHNLVLDCRLVPSGDTANQAEGHSQILVTISCGRQQMATLGRDELLKLIETGSMRIEPFRKDQVGPASIDLHLGDSFRVFEKTRDVFHVREDADYKQLTRAVKVDRNSSFLIMPNELVQGITEETLALPPTLSGRIEGRSRFARDVFSYNPEAQGELSWRF